MHTTSFAEKKAEQFARASDPVNIKNVGAVQR